MDQNTVQGYQKSLFPNYKTDMFDCTICQFLCKDPRQCGSCGRLYCHPCLESFKANIGFAHCLQCEKDNFVKLGQNLVGPYNNLEMKCKCNQLVTLGNLAGHQAQCKVNLPKCKNFDVCQQNVSIHMKEEGVCETACLLFLKIQECNKDQSKIHRNIREVLNDMNKGKLFNGKPTVVVQKQLQGNNNNTNNFNPQQMQMNNNYNKTNGNQYMNLTWCPNKKGKGVVTGNGNKTCQLKENAYVFKTVLGNMAFNGGKHYWEIIPEAMTENEMKIGVARGTEFSMDQAFCDFNFGFAFYTLGSLRNGSNSSGTNYGKRFKNNGVLGIFLNMDSGQLSFSYNGQYFGVAFTDHQLRSGPIYPAVALLHCAGASIRYVPQIPGYFK